ncbi:hypothetical protein K3727_09600 [Rhodobacteraceae bacterium M382]|nr:hypothetical protein K3727_09600 [Rhodobacteraceae bacterium M382]
MTHQTEFKKPFEQAIWNHIVQEPVISYAEIVGLDLAPCHQTETFLGKLVSKGQLHVYVRRDTRVFYSAVSPDSATHQPDPDLVAEKIGRLELQCPAPGAGWTPTTPEETALFGFIRNRIRFFRRELIDANLASANRTEVFFRDMRRLGIIREIGREQNMPVFTALDLDEFFEWSRDTRMSSEGMIWTAIRSMQEFTVEDLLLGIGEEAGRITAPIVRAYCRTLVDGQYLREARVNSGKRQRTRTWYRLLHDTGPFPPIKRLIPVIFDQNEETVTKVLGGLS